MKSLLRIAIWTATAIFTAMVFAQVTQYESKLVNVNIGDPARADFTFNGATLHATGSTLLVVQCDFNRAWLITNFYTAQQSTSQFFTTTCTPSVNDKVYSEIVNNTPFTVGLTMTDRTGHQFPLQLTVNSANWQSTEEGCGRSGSDCFKNGQGVASISY